MSGTAGRQMTADLAKPPGLPDREHEDARRGPLAVVGRQLEAGGVAEEKLLQADAGAESKGPRAQPADRPSRDLEDPCPLVVQADLGVDRAFA